jgi:GT2 family glycosyltransferase
MVELFERTKADCLARPQPLVPSVPSRMARAVAAARTSLFGHSGRSTIYDHSERPASPVSAGAMYRREVFGKAGNFDPDFDACEDVEFNYRVERAGCSCWTSPRLAVHYEPRRTFGALFRQMFRYGIGRRRLHRKHPESFTPETLIPIAFVLGLPFVTAPLWAPSPWGWILAAPYFLYLAACLVISVHAASKAGWDLLPYLPPAFFATHAGLGAGYLAGLRS